MKNLFSLFVTLLVTTSLWAYDFQSGELYYTITSSSEPYTVEVTYQEYLNPANYSSLTTATIPASVTYNGTTYRVTSIGEAAFWACSFTSITIPNSVTSIGGFAFEYCSSLTSITIPNSVTSIGYLAFEYCSSLTSITIPNSVTSIGSSAFRGCSSLTSVTIPNSVTSIGSVAFSDCSSLTSITIGNSVTSIGNEAFAYCPKLTSVTINSDAIVNKAYSSSSNISRIFGSQVTEYIIGESVTSIGNYAFYNCSLTSIIIPNSVTSIGDRAFWYCSALKSITCEATIPPTVGADAFYGVSTSIPVYVPCGQVDAYKAASGWSKFTNIQEPQAEYSIQVSASNSLMGTAQVDKNNACGCNISATPNYGYHFVQWSDGNTDNPRSLELTRDTVLTVEFAPNKYTLSIQSDNSERGTTSGDITTTYLDYVTISATAYYGYHFSHWNDYNYDNPRQVQVKEDKTYTAYFDKNTYYITKNYDSNQGYVNGYSSGKYLDNITLTAEANYGYHFTQWSDGNTENPRSLILTQDTTFTAEFAPNQYTITTTSSQPDRGTTQGDTTVNYREYTTISADANYGYHFSHWNDYNYDNPRQVQVKEDKTYTAYFDKNTYYITKNYDSNQGYINGSSSGEYLDNITLTATPNIGYHFVQWSDGNTANPRTFTLTQDTAFTAEFAQSFSGQCGDNLYWSYNETAKTVSITGSGKMYDYTASTQPWILFKEDIKEVTICNKATSIGISAFEGCISLGKLSIGPAMKNIAANAFAGCTRLYDIYTYATYPPFAEESSFANYNVYLYIPCEYQRDYTLDVVWGKFQNIECLSDEPTDMENIETPSQRQTNVQKLFRNGQLVIIRDGKTYNAMGQEM